MFFNIQKNVDNFLLQVLARGDVNGAYLFSGVKDLGKKTTAVRFFSSLFCQKNNGLACQKCDDCQLFANQTHQNFYQVSQADGRQEIVIEQIKLLKQGLQKRAIGQTGYKTVLIDDADCLNASSANALLKILEEPVGKTIFILLDHKRQRIIPTISSRCQIVRFLPSSPLAIKLYLEKQLGQKLKLDQLVEFANGRYRNAEQYAREPEIWKSRQQTLDELLAKIIFFQEADLLATPVGDDWAEQKESATRLVENYKFIWHNILLFQLGLPTYLQTHHNLEQLRKFLKNISLLKIVHRLETAIRVLSGARHGLPSSILLSELIFF